MKTTWISPEEDPRWRALLERYHSDVFHSPEWMRALRVTYGFEIRALLAIDDAGQPLAGVPIARICDGRGERLISLPFSDFCDPLLDSQQAWTRLADELLDLGLPIRFRLLHNPLPLSDTRFDAYGEARWHGLALDQEGGQEAIFERFDKDARTGIRRAESSGVRIETVTDTDGLRAFHNLHVGVRKRKYRLLAQPYSFFEALWDEFLAKDQGVLLLAYREDELLAGTLYLTWRDTLYYKFNASAGVVPNYRPNELLMWHGIQYGIERGLRCLDFGLSDADQEGLLRYKRKYSPREETIKFLRSRAPAQQPKADAISSTLGRLTELFTEPGVPDSVSADAGALLYRFFV